MKTENMGVTGLTKEEMQEETRQAFIDSNVSLFKELEVQKIVKAVTTHAFEVNKSDSDKANLENYYKDAQRVVKRLHRMLVKQGAEGVMYEMVLAGALLAKSFKNLESMKDFHTLEFGPYIKEQGLVEDLPEHIVEGVSNIVRSYLGPMSVFKEFCPKPGSPEYLVSIAYELLVD